MLKIFYFSLFLLSPAQEGKVMTFAYPTAQECQKELNDVKKVIKSTPKEKGLVVPLHGCRLVEYNYVSKSM